MPASRSRTLGVPIASDPRLSPSSHRWLPNPPSLRNPNSSPSTGQNPAQQKTSMRSNARGSRRVRRTNVFHTSESRVVRSSVMEEDDDMLHQVVVAIDIKDLGRVGCACYVAIEERLLCMEEIVGDGQAVIDNLLIDLQPTTVLISTRANSNLSGSDLLARSRQTSLAQDGDEGPPLPYEIAIRPSSEFGFESAKNKLVGLDLGNSSATTALLIPGEPSDYTGTNEDIGMTDRQGRLSQIAAWLNLENKISLGCAGAVITYLQRKRASEYLRDDPAAEEAYRITAMEMFTIRGTMLLNEDTLRSLQIIQPESHPNAFNQGPGTSGSKESFSIYGLFQHLARTPQGRARLRQHFLRPSLDILRIGERHDLIAVCVHPENLGPLHKLSKSMARIKNMKTTMVALHKGINGGNGRLGRFKSGVWASLLEFCYHTMDVADGLAEIAGGEKIPLIASGVELLQKYHLQRIGRMIHDVVDLELSIEQHRTVIKYGVDDNLDKIKEMYNGMDELLSRAARQIAESIPGDVILNVIYFPQLGFHITVPMDQNTGQPTYTGGAASWEKMFATQNQVYFKDPRMRELDDQLGDLYNVICDLEIEIAYKLAQKLLEDEKFLVDASTVCGDIDSMLAFAQGAVQYKLIRPKMTEQNLIRLKGCRHLLQEMTVPSYVPNDAFLVGGQGRDQSEQETPENATSVAALDGPSMILLTGPNYSGKSVYQKQVALAVYMAHIGSFVPAEFAEIGLTDKILTRIASCETVSKTQSAFLTDLQQIGSAINQSSRRTLIVIDEFGKGTDSCDGVGLASGVFQHFLSLGTECPKVLGATHFHEIFENSSLEAFNGLTLLHMEVCVDRTEKGRGWNNQSKVTYLYNLQNGRSQLSYGTQCAALNGIPAPVVSRAVTIAHAMTGGEDLVALCTGLSSKDVEDLANAEEIARAFISYELGAAADMQALTDTLDELLPHE